MSNKKLTEDIHKPNTRKVLKKRSILTFYGQFLEC